MLIHDLCDVPRVQQFDPEDVKPCETMEKRLSKLVAMSYRLDTSICKLRRAKSNYLGGDRRSTRKRGKLRRTNSLQGGLGVAKQDPAHGKNIGAIEDRSSLQTIQNGLANSKSPSPAAA